MNRKLLLWLPIIGVFIVGYYQLYKREDIVSLDRTLEFLGSSIYHAFIYSWLINFLY
jgi:hypothetical protein